MVAHNQQSQKVSHLRLKLASSNYKPLVWSKESA